MMRPSQGRRLAGALAALCIVAACRSAPGAGSAAAQPASSAGPDGAAIARARADSVRHPYTAADVAFMAGMIHHHAQAIRMSRLAPPNGASPSIRTLSARIISAQEDEIVIMQQWLRDRRQPVPEPHAAGAAAHDHAGEHHAGHEMSMPGMLTPVQMQQLEEARGREFDRLFLTFMIQHHRGALTMVRELFGTQGAAQDQTVFKLASEIDAEQSTEIARMGAMLAALLIEPSQ